MTKILQEKDMLLAYEALFHLIYNLYYHRHYEYKIAYLEAESHGEYSCMIVECN